MSEVVTHPEAGMSLEPVEEPVTMVRIPLPLWNATISMLSCVAGQLTGDTASEMASLVTKLIKEAK